jgi:hypothetical protein
MAAAKAMLEKQLETARAGAGEDRSAAVKNMETQLKTTQEQLVVKDNEIAQLKQRVQLMEGEVCPQHHVFV